MNRLLELITSKSLLFLSAALALAALGWRCFRALPVDVFPDIAVPRVVIQTEAPGLTAEEVEQRVSVPVETAMNGIPNVSTIRSSSSGGLSFVWVDFDWGTDLTRARFDVFERLQRVRESLPPEVDVEIAPTVSVTGEIMLVALTSAPGGATPLELRELAEYVLRPRLLGVKGIGEVAVMGGRLPECRISVSPRHLAAFGLTVGEIVDAVRDTRTNQSAGYLADVAGEELPLRQIARADTIAALAQSPVVRGTTGALRLGEVTEVAVAGAPRRGSASFDGRDAVVLSVQKVPGGNTPELTRQLDRELEAFGESVRNKGVTVHANAYRQADFIGASIRGGAKVVRDAVIVVLIVLVMTLFRVRTILTVLASMALTIPIAALIFQPLGLGVNVMTLGGLAVAAGDIVDAAIIFTEAIWRRRDLTIAQAVATVLPGVAFSTLIVALVFVPLLMLSGLEGNFFRPLALAYLAVFVTSLLVAFVVTPALSKLLRRGNPSHPKESAALREPLGVRVMKAVYRPFLAISLKVPVLIVLAVVAATVGAVIVARGFGSSFLPPFREDAFNVALSLPPGASLVESERVAEACVSGLRRIPGVLSVTRRTGRAERDQHAEPVSSSEFVVRVDLDGDAEGVRRRIREHLGGLPGCSALVGYPIAHRISAVLSGTEAEVAVNVYGDDQAVLRDTVDKMRRQLETMSEVSDVRANREVTVRTLRIDYDLAALAEAGLSLREAGEQVSVAFNGLEVGEIREGLKRRAVVVRLEGIDGKEDGRRNKGEVEEVKSLLLSSRSGRRVRLDEVAQVVPEEASDLNLREGGRRKALISLNPAEGVDTGELVRKLHERLDPIAAASGCSVGYGGSHEARESAGRRLAVLAVVLIVVVFLVLVAALRELSLAALALVNVPLGVIGGVAAVKLANPVLSVSSLVGFVTVIGFVLRNGILLLQRYREGIREGLSVAEAIRLGSLERMVPIIMTSLTTVLGLIPLILAGEKPGGELLAPLAVVQFGGILGATVLNLVVLPAAAKLVMKGGVTAMLMLAGISVFTGCRSYEPSPIDWAHESGVWLNEGELAFESLDQVGKLALVGNLELNRLRLKRASSERLAQATGWWDDPELDVDLLRVVNPSEHPLIGGASLAFTIPLSGVKGLERKAAEAYSAADAADIVAAECETESAARSAALRIVAAREVVGRLRSFDVEPRIIGAFAAAEQLSEAGELSKTEMVSARLRRHQRLHRLRDAEREVDALELELRRILGVGPRVRMRWGEKGEEETRGAAEPQSGDLEAGKGPLDYVRHPRVRAAVVRLEGGEAALEAEIRRQYPELKVGPAYSREEGLDRFGIVAGLSLPLWNRNRKGIAEAESARDEVKFAAVRVWRELVLEADAARRTLHRLKDHRPTAALRGNDPDRLYDAGEINALEYLAIREEALDGELMERDWHRDLRLAEENLRKYEVEEKQ